MARIIPKSTYDKIPVLPKLCVVTMPITITCGKTKYVLLEESCFVKLRPNHADESQCVPIRKVKKFVSFQKSNSKRKRESQINTPSRKKGKAT